MWAEYKARRIKLLTYILTVILMRAPVHEYLHFITVFLLKIYVDIVVVHIDETEDIAHNNGLQ